MAAALVIPLNTTPAQASRLEALQQVFADVCNALSPVVRDTRCWNRVALHHMTYRGLRDKFPQLGSQMVCNAIYSVSRTSRLLYQSPRSPFNIARLGSKPLPLLHFTPRSPVYFDRHTLSLKAGHLSMFTLDGRMRFELQVTPAIERRFHDEKLQEIALSRVGGAFQLQFLFAQTDGKNNDDESAADGQAAGAATELPEYVLVLPEATAPLPGDRE